jgi:hypothetical protein
MFRPGDSISVEFVVSNPSTGAAVNADALPTTVVVHNGTDTGAVSLTVTNVDTGRYLVSGTVPGGWLDGDTLNIVAEYAVSAVAMKKVLISDVIRIADPTASAVATAVINSMYADTGILALIASTGGAFSVTIPGSFPGTGTMVLKDINGDTCATYTLTFDLNGNITGRTVTL